MDYDKIINELNQAWSLLEALSASGYSTRMRINTAQEHILSVYNAVNKAKKEAEKEEVSDEDSRSARTSGVGLRPTSEIPDEE